MKLLTRILIITAVCGLAPRLLADSIRLQAAATVDTTAITLADVAELDGEHAEAFAHTEVARREGFASTINVHLEQVRQVLTDAGADWSTLSLTGYQRCLVTQGSEIIVAQAEPNDAGVLIHSPVSVEETDGRRVADLLNERLAELTGAPLSELQITLPEAADQVAVLNRDAADGRYELIPTSRTGLGRVPVRVMRYDSEGRVDDAMVTVEVSRRVTAVTAAYDVRRDERFTETNLKVREVLISTQTGPFYTDVNEVIGKRADAALREGAVITAGDLTEELLVERGDLITVSAISGRLVVRTVARATEDASLGELVALRHDDTRETFYATVAGPRAATIQTASPDASAAR